MKEISEGKLQNPDFAEVEPYDGTITQGKATADVKRATRSDQKGANLRRTKKEATKQVANRMKVSERSVQHAEKVLAPDRPEVIAKVETGQLVVSRAESAMMPEINNNNKQPVHKPPMGNYLHDLLHQSRGDLSRAVRWLTRDLTDLEAYRDFLSQPEVEQMKHHHLCLAIVKGVVLQLEAISGDTWDSTDDVAAADDLRAE